MDIGNSIAIVTGGGSGLGAATARSLAAAGARVAHLDFNAEAAEAEAAQTKGIAVHCDVSSAESAEGALAQVIDRIGVPRILVNCAGIAPPAKILGRNGVMPLKDFSRIVEVNLLGTFNMIRLFGDACRGLDPLDGGERGVIVNTASVAAFEGQVGQSAYSASKGGVVALTLTVAREFASLGIRCCTIAPGIFETPMLRSLPQEAQDNLGAMIPFPSRLGKSEEFAKLARHVVENQMLNGETIRLDGAIRMAPR